MNTSIITIKTDQKTKEAAQQLAKDTGISLSGLINSYLRQVVSTRHINIYAPEQMTPELEKKLEDVEKRRSKKEASKGYENAQDFMDAVLS